ncbi:DUF2249 domain-containing protein [Methylibium sp.]|uniref:DUF2249 domain-containing protein n=1 Tax=Methylibium sp. TaxID=2067992 RepID=UPI003D13CD21
MSSTPAASATLDVRSIPPRERHPLIFSTFQSLRPGATLELVNDHDPAPLRPQFQACSPGEFEWSYLQAGPVVWRVQIVKLAPREHCCGSCH